MKSLQINNISVKDVYTLNSKSYGKSRVPLQPLQGLTKSDSKRKLSHAIEHLVLLSEKRSINAAIESSLKYYLFAENVYCYTLTSDESKLFSPSAFNTISIQKGIIGQFYNRKEVLLIEKPTADPNFDIVVDPPNNYSLYVPLLNFHSKCMGVAILFGSRGHDEEDVRKARKFAERFKIYSRTLLNRNNFQPPADTTIKQLESHLNVRKIDVFAKKRNVFMLLNPDTGDFEQTNQVGAAKNSLLNCIPEIFNNVKDSDFFFAPVDGDVDEPVAFIPFVVDNQNFVMVFRGKLNAKYFNTSDIGKMEAIVPLFRKQFVVYPEEERKHEHTFAEKLKALLEVAESLSGVLDIDTLVPIIMNRACSLLKTERCSLFTIDQVKKQLISRFSGGLKQILRLPLDKGIVGHTATTGQIVNISDAYVDPRFDQSVDLKTGFRTRTILTVPIYNNRGEITGVTEMINRLDGQKFDDDDVRMMVAFNVFCGISLDNANLYATSVSLTNHLRKFVEASSALRDNLSIEEVTKEIMENAMATINGKYVSVYLYDVETDKLTELATVGEGGPTNTNYMMQALIERQPKIFDEIEETAVTMNENSNLSSRIHNALEVSEISYLEHSHDQRPTISILVFPLSTNDGVMIGAMQMYTKQKVMNEDFKLLDCFAVFSAVALERERLKKIAELGETEAEVMRLFDNEERNKTTVPKRLSIPESKMDTIYSINFDAPRWDGIGHFKVLIEIFDHWEIFNTFNIPTDKFFRFIKEISDTYKKVPYHNWRHAVDVTQFISYQVRTSRLDKVLTRLELFCLLVAGICHDANHDGFTNVFNEKTETPLGILFKNQSVMETHHCQVAIGVISKEECNIFSCFESEEYKKIWSIIISLILSTDMAKHHSFLQEANKRMDEGPLDSNSPEDRYLMMELLLKCADISNVSRPFELANKWCDVLCEEFFRQGDLEKTAGMEYTSPLNDRAHLDKPKSQIGFYSFVCLPLYQTCARAIPALQVNVDQIQSNLEEWKRRIKS